MFVHRAANQNPNKSFSGGDRGNAGRKMSQHIELNSGILCRNRLPDPKTGQPAFFFRPDVRKGIMLCMLF